jgi:hypothetical protein
VSEGQITTADINVAEPGRRSPVVGPRADWNGKLGHTEVTVAPEPRVGETLKATVTTKRNDVTPEYRYYWTDGANVIGEGPELTVGKELQGKELSVFVLVTGEKAWPRWTQATAGEAALQPQLSPDTPPSFTEGAEPQVGAKTVVDVGSWDLEPDQVQYQWLLNDEAIPGATGPSHIPAPDQVYGMLSLQLTLLRQHHEPTTWTVMADDLVAPGPEATFAATVSGKAAVGKRLKASRAPVGWDASYQWLRSGEPIRNATSRSYKLRKADAGAEISVAVTATKPGYTETTEFSPAKSVPKFKSTIKVTRPKASNPRKFTVRVKIKGTADTGKIRVTVGAFSKTYKLKKGKATPKLPNLSKGSHKVKVTYLGTSQNAKSTKKAVFRFR